jgi:L,D-transpeptidase YcbB
MAAAGTLADLRWPDYTNIRDQVRTFYDAGADQLAWTTGGKPIPQALAMIQQFKNASMEGLNPEDYDASRWDSRIAKLESPSPAPTPDDIDHFDVAMTVSAMRFISDLHKGRVNPQSLNLGADADTSNFDLAAVLRAQFLTAANMDAAVQGIEPQYAGYKRAEGALDTYLKLEAQGDTKPLPMPVKSVHPGNPYPDIADLVARLRQLDDIPADADVSTTATNYEGPVVDCVKHFQERMGIEPDGVLGKATVTELNRPLSYRVEQLELTLERYRWIPTSFQQPPLVINIPEFILRTMRLQPAPFLTMRVVVGKAYGKETPVFAQYMKYVIFHPYWDVPPSIIHAEMIPKIRRNPDYIEDNDFEVVNSSGDVVTDGEVGDDVLSGLRSGRYTIHQKPGDKNALGPIKFIFPNSFDVYLHGTPAQSLFARARRDFSHGCIRVENPEALAEWVLRDQPGWDPNRIKQVLAGDQTVKVTLDKPIPVLILYSTAVVEPDGEIKFFDDIYHYDEKLKAELAAGYPAKS